ncbi:MAG: hypothetical protein AAF603_11820, partial [Pseudomonadota bacterium]
AVKVAAIALIGGVTLFTAYSYLKDPSPETESDDSIIAADQDALPSSIEAETVSPPDLTEEERLARLGEGGVLEEGENFDFRVAGEERSVHDRMGDFALEREDKELLALLDELDTAPQVTAPDVEDTTEAPRQLRGLPDIQAPEIQEEEPLEVATAPPNSETVPSLQRADPAPTPMTKNPVLVAKKDDGKFFTQNKVLTAKKDDGKFFTANKKRVAKKDDGQFFTLNGQEADLDPCVKADGTPYVGPGTAINPFAPENPCLLQATDGSFEIVEAPIIPQDPLPEDDGRYGLPLPPGFTGPIGPLPPDGGNFGSDYRSI